MTGRLHLAVVVLVAAILCVGAAGLGNDYQLLTAFMICVYYLCAAGTGVLVGYAGQKSIGQAGFFGIGAYTAALLTANTGANPWLALPLAMILAGVFGLVIALPALRVKGTYLAMVTLAFGIVVEKVFLEWTDIFGGAIGIFGVRPLSLNGHTLTLVELVWFAIGLSAVTYLLLRNLLRGRVGRALLALQSDEIAAASVGVGVYRFKIIAFVVAAVTCGLGGALVVLQTQYVNADFVNFRLSIMILLIVLLGGVHSLYGPIAGAVVLTLVETGLARWPAAQQFVYGAVLLFSLYAMPTGLVGAGESAWAKWGPRRKPASRPDAGSWDERPAPANRSGGEVILSVGGLKKYFGGIRVAENVSFELRRGHVHALIGPNGAGKTTMINMLTGIIRPDGGSLRFRGGSLVGVSPSAICRMGIARTFQNLRLFGELSVLDNVMVGRHARMRNGFVESLFGLPSERAEEAAARGRALALLDLFGLGDVADAKAGSLPYGRQRRVELARALATDPELLLLDEPAAGLNPQETFELGDLLLRIGELGITILMVEHHMDLVMRISDHVIVLDYGQKIAEGAPAEVQNNPKVIEAYLGVEDEDDEADWERGEVAGALGA